jgi:Sulfotransferase domain
LTLQKISFHGVPRSGTSWLGAIFDSSKNVAYRHQPLFSYAFKSYLTESSSKIEIEKFFNLINESNDDFILQNEGKIRGHIPKFYKENITHIIYKEARYHHILLNMMEKHDTLKIVGIVRNPKSVISSWYNAPKEFNKEKWNILDEWKNAGLKNKSQKEEFYGYNKWKEVANLFLSLKEKYPKRFFLLEYKELLNRTEEAVKDLFNFSGIEFSKQTAEFLSLSKKKDLSNDAYSVYRVNQVDDKWKTDLPKEIIESIDTDLKGSELEKYNK